MLGKVGTAQTQHWAPPGTYLLVIFATFWPVAAFAAMAIPFAWANRREDGVAFLVAWVLPSWLVFEAVPTKLPHYVLPLCTALAILAVMAVARGAVHRDRPGARLVALLVPFIPPASRSASASRPGASTGRSRGRGCRCSSPPAPSRSSPGAPSRTGSRSARSPSRCWRACS